MKHHRPADTHRAFLVSAAVVTLLAAAPAMAQTNQPAGGQLPYTLLRDPFWPAGWQPTYFGQIDETRAGGEALTRWGEAEKLLRVSGLSRNSSGRFVASIKGVGVVQEGETVAVNLSGLTYKWTIRSITARGLVLDKVGAQPMR